MKLEPISPEPRKGDADTPGERGRATRRFAARPHILLAACFLAHRRSSGWLYQGVCEEYESRL